jgi:hypothetical protein
VSTVAILLAGVLLSVCAVLVIEPARMTELLARVLRRLHGRGRTWPRP